jgi:putative protease
MSSWLFNVETDDQLQELITLKEAKPAIIIGSTLTARTFSWSWRECQAIAVKLKQHGFTVFLQWDILMTEQRFNAVSSQLSDLGLFDAVRVQDPGALWWLKGKDIPIHFIAETGNHNLVGLKKWCELAGDQLKRVVLSPDLDHGTVFSMMDGLSVECEIQALGRLLLFYTPRSLLSPLSGEDSKDKWIEASGTSEESPHKGFPLIENSHGTFMFNTKDLFILDDQESMNEVFKRGNLHLRCDTSSLSLSSLARYFRGPSFIGAKELRATYDKTVIKGFFRTNKTDVLFKKLKNSRLQERGDALVGEVVEVKKKKHVAIHLREGKSFVVGQRLRFVSPEGNIKEVEVKSIKNASGKFIDETTHSSVVYVPPVGGVSVRTQVLGT